MGGNWVEQTEYEYKKEVIKKTGTLQKAMDFYTTHKMDLMDKVYRLENGRLTEISNS